VATPEFLRGLAAETVAILEEGGYQSIGGKAIELREAIKKAMRSSVLYKAGHNFVRRPPVGVRGGGIEVTEESVCLACKRLILRDDRIVVLNFASPVRPGGGWLVGQPGQEPSIARSSALVPTIARHEEFYRAGEEAGPIGSDAMVYSPDVPFFRDDDGTLLDEPFLVSVISCAPVDAARCRGRPDIEGEVAGEMKKRMRKILLCAIQYGHKIMVIGAFGCGEFGNDASVVAKIEKELLIDEQFGQYFDLVANPIFDGPRTQNFAKFNEVLAPYLRGD
jgi:uncharacterized protein (TIGR02452 family)